MPARDAQGRFVGGGGSGRVSSGGGGLTISMEVFGDVQLNRTLLRASERSRNLSPVFSDLANDFLKIERQQFDTQGGFSGGWKPLAESTIARKAALGLDPRILHATLALQRSLTQPGAPGFVRQISRSSMFVGSDVKSKDGFPYPAVHQNPQSSRLPQRRPVELDEAHRRSWMKRIQQFIVGDAGAGGYR